MVRSLPTWVHLPAPHLRGTCSDLLPKQVSVKGKEPKGEIRKPTRRSFILPRAGLLMMGGQKGVWLCRRGLCALADRLALRGKR